MLAIDVFDINQFNFNLSFILFIIKYCVYLALSVRFHIRHGYICHNSKADLTYTKHFSFVCKSCQTS